MQKASQKKHIHCLLPLKSKCGPDACATEGSMSTGCEIATRSSSDSAVAWERTLDKCV